MAGIYLHIPYCKQACHYCNFHFSTSLKGKPDFLQSLLREIDLRKDYLEGESIETIYFGGGTPSLLLPAELNLILEKIYKCFPIQHGAEITFEANPDDVLYEGAVAWKAAGINRLSMGVQSFYEDDLKWMNRAHTAGQALNSIKTVQDAGFDNITIDLIYGSPSLSDAKWEHNVQQAISLGIPHLSCYALTVEPRTALATMIEKHRSPPVHSEDQARQFLLLMDWLHKVGYLHYEISNFAKPGMHSRHNSAYWSGKSYIGFGPSAHSYNGSTRQWNVANNRRYIQSLTQGQLPFEIEHLTARDKQNEFVMISLRRNEGISKKQFAISFGPAAFSALTKSINKHIISGAVVEDEVAFSLTREGKLFADGIAADLFI